MTKECLSAIVIGKSGWNLDAYVAHNEAMRVADKDAAAERDRRYSEVTIEREKAIKIKEAADNDALALARQIQSYKDEKANQLREQISNERGLYATKNDLVAVVEKLETAIKPLAAYVAIAQGRGAGIQSTWGVLIAVITMLMLGLGTFVAMKSSSGQAQVIMLPAPVVGPPTITTTMPAPK